MVAQSTEEQGLLAGETAAGDADAFRKRQAYRPDAPGTELHFAFDDVLVEVHDGVVDMYVRGKSDRSMDYKRQPALRSQFQDAYVPLEDLDGVPLAYGITTLVGAGGSGKSPLAASIANSLGDCMFLEFGEPLPWFEQRTEYAALAIVQAYLENRSVVIDSIKDLFFTGKGATGAGGINKSLFRDISQWGAMFASKKLHLVVTTNVLTDDDRLVREAAESLNSSSNMVMMYDRDSSAWKYRVRDFVTEKRTAGEFRYDANVKAIVHGSIHIEDTSIASETEVYAAGNARDDDAFVNALARAAARQMNKEQKGK